MKVNEAIIRRINEVCQEKKISIARAAMNGGITPAPIYDLIKGRTKCSTVETIQRFCEGAGITLAEFFSKDYFNEYEIEE